MYIAFVLFYKGKFGLNNTKMYSSRNKKALKKPLKGAEQVRLQAKPAVFARNFTYRIFFPPW